MAWERMKDLAKTSGVALVVAGLGLAGAWVNFRKEQLSTTLMAGVLVRNDEQLAKIVDELRRTVEGMTVRLAVQEALVRVEPDRDADGVAYPDDTTDTFDTQAGDAKAGAAPKVLVAKPMMVRPAPKIELPGRVLFKTVIEVPERVQDARKQ